MLRISGHRVYGPGHEEEKEEDWGPSLTPPIGPSMPKDRRAR